jgi:hypothetical protein
LKDDILVWKSKRPYIELESTWIHDCPSASDGMPMSKKVDC